MQWRGSNACSSSTRFGEHKPGTWCNLCTLHSVQCAIGRSLYDIPPHCRLFFLFSFAGAAQPAAPPPLPPPICSASGHRTEYLHVGDFRAQMRAAAKAGAAWVMMIGEEEVVNGVVAVKQMGSGERATPKHTCLLLQQLAFKATVVATVAQCHADCAISSLGPYRCPAQPPTNHRLGRPGLGAAFRFEMIIKIIPKKTEATYYRVSTSICRSSTTVKKTVTCECENRYLSYDLSGSLWRRLIWPRTS